MPGYYHKINSHRHCAGEFSVNRGELYVVDSREGRGNSLPRSESLGLRRWIYWYDKRRTNRRSGRANHVIVSAVNGARRNLAGSRWCRFDVLHSRFENVAIRFCQSLTNKRKWMNMRQKYPGKGCQLPRSVTTGCQGSSTG